MKTTIKNAAHTIVSKYIEGSIKADRFCEKMGINAATKKTSLKVLAYFDPHTAEVLEKSAATLEERETIIECSGEIIHAIIDALDTPKGSIEREGVDAALKLYAEALFAGARKAQERSL